jgi:response regulator RpfG family c-di-GMP phosphodiesterase
MTKKLGERLVEAGIATPEAIQQALQHQRITGHKLGDCLVETGLVTEQALLRFLATEFNTRFVSTEKLARAKIHAEVLDRIPVRMAESQLFLPLAIDPERKILSIVAAEPQNQPLLDEVALVTGMSEVYPYVGLRSAIAAAIRKHYYGDPTAFVSPQGPSLRADITAMTRAYESNYTDSRSAPSLSLRFDTEVRTRRSSQVRYQSQLRDALGRGGLVENDYLETLRVLVGLIETSRGERRGHSAQLARQASLVARRMALPPREVTYVAMAAYLHDLGKPAERHFTLASNDQQPDWKAEARDCVRTPVRLFESVHLPVQVNAILAQSYEAYDGSGTPQGAKADDIATGARILAAVDSYLDLIKNPGNACGRVFSKDEALNYLQENSGRLFDPGVVEMVGRLHSGELLRHRIEAEGRQVLVADSDAAALKSLLGATTERGLVTQAVSTLEGTYDAAFSGDSDVLVLSLRFGVADVTALLQLLKGQPETAGLPVLVMGDPEQATLERLQGMGAEVAPLANSAAQVAERAEQLFEIRRTHGGPGKPVRGSFDEVSLGDVLHILGMGRKSGRLLMREDAHEGFLHIEQGRVVFASFGGEAGESSLRSLLSLKEADFTYDPESLLLELPHLDQDLERLVHEMRPQRRSA